MKIKVPFIYSATVIKPKCRNTTEVIIEDSIDVEIAEHENLPVAFKVGNLDYYWDNKSLWVIVSEYNRISDTNINITLKELKQNTENPHEDLKSNHMEAPFFIFTKYCSHYNYSYRNIEVNYSSKDEAVKQNREYLKDDKDEVVLKIKAIAQSIIIHKGLLYKKIEEPRYKIDVFGMGGNHGSTSMSIENGFNRNCGLSSYYSALEYNLALETAIKIATRRRDTNSIDYLKEKEKIEVIIPEAVQLDMTKEIKDICIMNLKPINLLEMKKDDFLNLVNEKYFEQYSRKIRVLDFEANFTKDGIDVLILESEKAA